MFVSRSVFRQVTFNEDNLADISAEVEGPGAWAVTAMRRAASFGEHGWLSTQPFVHRLTVPLVACASAGTPFEGGLFKMKLLLPADFPASAPKGTSGVVDCGCRHTPLCLYCLTGCLAATPGFFLTKIFHPNIRYTTGEICVNTLKRDWQPSHGIRHILMVIRCLLIEPFPESALNEEAAKMLLEEYDEYFKRARMLTSIHARNDRKTHKPQGQQLPPPQCGAPGLEGSQDQDAPALGNATNMVSVPADENDEGTAAGGAGGCGEPPLKKLDRKKSLKRL